MPVELGLDDYGIEGVAIDVLVCDILQFGGVAPVEMKGGDDALSARYVQEAGKPSREVNPSLLVVIVVVQAKRGGSQPSVFLV